MLIWCIFLAAAAVTDAGRLLKGRWIESSIGTQLALNSVPIFRFYGPTVTITRTTLSVSTRVIYTHSTCLAISRGTPPCAQEVLLPEKDPANPRSNIGEPLAVEPGSNSGFTVSMDGYSKRHRRSDPSDEQMPIQPSVVENIELISSTNYLDFLQVAPSQEVQIEASKLDPSDEYSEFEILGPPLNQVHRYLPHFMPFVGLTTPMTLVHVRHATITQTETVVSPWPFENDGDRVTFIIAGCVPLDVGYPFCD